MQHQYSDIATDIETARVLVRMTTAHHRLFTSRVAPLNRTQTSYPHPCTSLSHPQVYNAARLKETGEDFVKESAMAKLHCARVAG